MIEYDKQYKNILDRILKEGFDCPDRTGTGCRKVFDVNINANLRHDAINSRERILPLLGLRKSYARPFWVELFWMLSGSTDANVLKKKNIHIWDANTSDQFKKERGLEHLPDGSIGDGYGKQFRNFNGVDQLKDVMKGLISDPYGRRHYISLWNPSDLPNTMLAPCHTVYNFVVIGEFLNLKFFQRSSDWVLAGGANFVFASFFLAWMADRLGFKVGDLAHSISDCHIYHNHLDAARHMRENGDDMTVIDHVTTYNLPESNYVFSSEDDIDNYLDDEIRDMLNDDTWDIIKNSLNYVSHDPIPKEMLRISA